MWEARLSPLTPGITAPMHEAPDRTVRERVLEAACAVDGVRNVENLKVRRSGLGFYVDLHAQADPEISLEDAHEIAATVKYAIVEAIPSVAGVLVHMEPYRKTGKLSDDPGLSLP